MNFGDPKSAEEEDAIMHLPVTLHVALIQEKNDEADELYKTLQNVKDRLGSQIFTEVENNQESVND